MPDNVGIEVPMVTITDREYNSLLQARDKLSALEVAGVDNWEGYDYALDILHGLD